MFFSYNMIKGVMRKDSTDLNETLTPQQHLTAGVVAGMSTLTLTNPIWVVKTRLCLQYESQQPKYRGFSDCLVKIYREEGLRGWYKVGTLSSVIMTLNFRDSRRDLSALRTVLSSLWHMKK